MIKKTFALLICLALACCALGIVACSQQDGPAQPDREQLLEDAGNGEDAAADEEPAVDGTVDEALKARIQELCDQTPLRVGVCYIDLAHEGASFSVQGERVFPAASVIKLAVLACYLDQTQNGAFDGSESYTLQSGDIVGGTGKLQNQGAGTAVTYDELARLMICNSDNTAANVLIDRLGMDAINDCAAKLGCKNTHLRRKMMDQAAVDAGVDNEMSADDAALILSLIYHEKLVSPDASKFAREALEEQSVEGGIELGTQYAIAHKTGNLPTAEHDAAIVYADKPYVVAVFAAAGSDGTFSAASAHSFAAEVVRAIEDAQK